MTVWTRLNTEHHARCSGQRRKLPGLHFIPQPQKQCRPVTTAATLSPALPYSNGWPRRESADLLPPALHTRIESFCSRSIWNQQGREIYSVRCQRGPRLRLALGSGLAEFLSNWVLWPAFLSDWVLWPAFLQVGRQKVGRLNNFSKCLIVS